jgi:hypothetical protein
MFICSKLSALSSKTAPTTDRPRSVRAPTKADDIRDHVLQLEGPEGAAHAPKAALHLVRHAHGAVGTHLLVYARQVRVGQEDLGEGRARRTSAVAAKPTTTATCHQRRRAS